MGHCLQCNESEVNVPTCTCDCANYIAAIRKAFNEMGEYLGRMQDRDERMRWSTVFTADVCSELEEILDEQT